MRLTKRRALEICIELWTWLAENPNRAKEEWPEWKKYGNMQSACPCCEYTKLAHTVDMCMTCPIWAYSAIEEAACAPCLADSSPFWSWCVAQKAHMQAACVAAAQSMVALAQSKLDALNSRAARASGRKKAEEQTA